MNIEKTLLAVHSRAQADKIVRYIGRDSQRFKILLELFLKGEYRIAQRAAWPLGICAEKAPELIKPYLGRLINNLKKPVHDAVKRNTMRILQEVEIPTTLMGKTADICFHYLSTPSEAVAIRAYSITVLLNIVKKYPDLKTELQLTIGEQMPYASAAFLSRARKALQELDRL